MTGERRGDGSGEGGDRRAARSTGKYLFVSKLGGKRQALLAGRDINDFQERITNSQELKKQSN